MNVKEFLTLSRTFDRVFKVGEVVGVIESNVFIGYHIVQDSYEDLSYDNSYMVEKITLKVDGKKKTYLSDGRCHEMSGMKSLFTLGECAEMGFESYGKYIPDKSPIACWDTHFKYYMTVRFYDAKYNSTFDLNGKRNGEKFDNYTIISEELAVSLWGGRENYDRIINSLMD